MKGKKTTITVMDLVCFFHNKQEHYPISSSFIEEYRQKSGGYIQFALETGHPIDADSHEPNQKWHLLESYCMYRMAKEKTAELTVLGFKCPELLLWMAEAAGIDAQLVEEAADYAKEKINDLRQTKPDRAYSAEAAAYMNASLQGKHGQTLWQMIADKIAESK